MRKIKNKVQSLSFSREIGKYAKAAKKRGEARIRMANIYDVSPE